ncbi:MAG: transposase [Kiritimatiellia bacterium]
MNHSDIHKTYRNLPHWTRPGSIYWITFRLADSIPKNKLDAWHRKREHWLRLHPKPWNSKTWHDYQLEFGERYESWLDQGHGSCALARSDCREVVKQCLFRFQDQRLCIHDAVIMPNHVHVLLEPMQGQELSKLMQGIKGASSRNCNLILGRSGTFWMAESYDHIVRSEREYAHFIRYIRENPGRANLRDGEFWLMPRG